MTLCPICSSASFSVRKLSADFIKYQLQIYYNEPLPDNLILNNYEIVRCSNCTLEYATPLISGDDIFYRWIGSHHTYYPNERWEWGIVLNKLRKSKYNAANLLEIGCGSGNFLEKVAQIPNMKGYGLDISISAIEECNRKKINVYFGTIDSLLQEKDVKGNRFEFIVAFHCLEHVNNPKQYLHYMVALLNHTGTIFISTPYSPMSFENSWFDPLNYPPHHLTRWNKKSLEELARQLNMNIVIEMPKASSALYRAAIAINYSLGGHSKAMSKYDTFLNCLKKPRRTVNEIICQLKRKKVNNKVAADVMLVELSHKRHGFEPERVDLGGL